ncbi:MAG TPA: pyridoxal phosphate-dependent aminotransferase [Terriglobales bacterium]|nr:pyridoxal phosphate-dependent aminotransferase [Terriglobales bacterium]
MPELSHRIGRISVSATAAMVNEAARLRAAGRDLVDFGAGEPDFPTPAHILESAIAALHAGDTKYTPTGGTEELKRAICQSHARDFRSDYQPNEVLATLGGKHALFNAMSVLVNHGDEVIIPAPYWVSFYDQVRYLGGAPVLVPTDEADGYALPVAAIERALTPRTKVILINSPANPSGAVYTAAAFQAVLEICRRRGLWLVSDECYIRLVYEQAPYSVACEPGSKSCLVISGSLSKTFAMTGWRLGYALGPAPVIAAMLSLQSHSTSNATSFVQKAGAAALLGPQAPINAMLDEYRRRRDLIVAGLRAITGITCALPGGAFYAYPNISGLLGKGRAATAAEFADRLLHQAGIVTVPGEAFGSQGHIRFSYATSREVIREGLSRLAQFTAAA